MPLVGDIANSTLNGRLKILRALPKGGALKILYKKENRSSMSCIKRKRTRRTVFYSETLRTGNLSGTQATSTYCNGLGRTVNDCLYLADVGLPHTIGLTVGVGHTLTEHYAFSTNTALCHTGHLLTMVLRPVETDRQFIQRSLLYHISFRIARLF